jgi:hypothetical protein
MKGTSGQPTFKPAGMINSKPLKGVDPYVVALSEPNICAHASTSISSAPGAHSRRRRPVDLHA